MSNGQRGTLVANTNDHLFQAITILYYTILYYTINNYL